MEKKKLPPRNSSNIQFWPLPASTWGFFTVFNHWNFLPAMFFSGKYLFGNAAFQVNAMIYPYCWVCCCCSRSVPILQVYARTWQIIDMSIQQYWGGAGWGKAGLTNRAGPVGSAWKGTTFRTRYGVGKQGYENFFLASILNGSKKFCIWRMEMLIYLF